jgi:hypothetical protein
VDIRQDQEIVFDRAEFHDDAVSTDVTFNVKNDFC